MSNQPEPELSRPLRIEKISPNGVEENMVARPTERQALAARFDLIDLPRLEAKLMVMPEHSGSCYLVTGSISADVVQRCVVTLEPLPIHIEQSLKVYFADAEFAMTGANERDMDEDDMEPIDNGYIDLGELVAQHLGLALDPYPRKAGLPPVEVVFGEPVVKANPFAKLALVKDDSRKK